MEFLSVWGRDHREQKAGFFFHPTTDVRFSPATVFIPSQMSNTLHSSSFNVREQGRISSFCKTNEMLVINLRKMRYIFLHSVYSLQRVYTRGRSRREKKKRFWFSWRVFIFKLMSIIRSVQTMINSCFTVKKHRIARTKRRNSSSYGKSQLPSP